MAGVRVIAPDGSTGTMDESELQSALADGFRLESDAAATPTDPVAAATVRVRAPDGSTGTMDASEFEQAKNDGFTSLDQEQYQTTGQQLATVGEGLARGATMGASDVVQAKGAGLGIGIGDWVADKVLGETPRVTESGIDAPLAGPRDLYNEQAAIESGADITGRREANRGLAIGSEIVGAVAPAILSGGVGSAAAAAKLTPAGQLANLATKMSGMLAPSLGKTAVGRITALAATGAAEGALDAATRQVMGDLAAGNVDITAERALEAAWEGAKWGGLAAGGAGVAVEGAQAVGKGIKAVAGKVAGELPSIQDFASGRAFKAALGKTNLKGVRKAYKHFESPEAVGKTLLDEGIVTADATIEDIAERSAAARDSIGKQLGVAVKQADELSGGKGLSRSALKQKLYDDVIEPLKKSPVNRDVGERLEAQMGGLLDELTPSPVSVRGKGQINRDGLSFEQANQWRKELDQRINWEKMAPDVASEAKQGIRSAMSEFWLDAADQAADKAGKAGFGDEIRALKKRFSHVALADDLASDAVASQLSNRFVSPSDYGVGGALGVAGSIASGGAGLVPLAMSAAGAFGNKLIRERGNQIVASTLYKLAKGAVSQEQATAQAVASTITGLSAPAVARVIPIATRAAAVSAPVADYSRLVAQSQELQDPDSPASQQLDAMTLQLAGESPELAEAIRQKVLQKATMIVQKMGPQTDPSDPLKQQRVLTDPVTQNRRDRFMRAIQNPAQALERLSSGHGSAEDLAIVRELTPMVHKRFVDGVMQQLVGGGHKLSLAQKQRLHRVLGQPVAREQTPAYVAFFSNLIGGKKPQQESQAMGQLPAERQGEFNSKEFAVDKHFGSRADALMGGTDD